MKIVLDSNVIFNDWHLSKPNFQLLERFLTGHSATLVVPKIVFEEAVSLCRTAVRQKTDAIRKKFRELKGLLGRQVDVAALELDIEKLSSEYRSRLVERLESLDAQIPEYGDVPLEALAQRAVQHRKPFPKEGDKGFKDALIWETILRKVATSEEHTVLISSNSTDFGDEEGLLPDYQQDLVRAGLPDNCVEVVASIESFNEKHVKPGLEMLEDVFKKMRGTTQVEWPLIAALFEKNGDDIADKVQELLAKVLESEEKETPTLEWLEGLHQVDVLNVFKMEEGRVFVESTVSCDASVDFCVLKSSMWTPEPPKSSFLSRDWNRHYSLASERFTVDIALSLVVDLVAGEVVEYEVDDVTRPFECPSCGGLIRGDVAEQCPHCGKSFA